MPEDSVFFDKLVPVLLITLGVIMVLTAALDDIPIKMGAHQPHRVTVVHQRIGGSRPHKTSAYNRHVHHVHNHVLRFNAHL